MTHHCPSCCGVTALTGHPDSPVRWCSCPPKPDPKPGPKDAEIARLRALVREAWEEGCHMDGNYDLEYDWRDSRAKKALDR